MSKYAMPEVMKSRVLAVPILILLNIAVFAMWTFPESFGVDFEFMFNHFLVSWTAVEEGRFWVLLTSVFSHNLFWHLLLNMFVLNSFGSIIEQMLGLKRFVAFYLIAGMISSISHAVFSNYIMGDPSIPALGASGAISGVILLFSLLFPKERILILGIIPIPALFGALLFVGLDIWGLTAQAGGGGLPIGHGAHLGGAFAGLLYYLYLRATRGKKTPS